MIENETSRVLTDRQVEIIGYVAQGLTFREIGDELGISGRTVQKHVDLLLKKMEARNKTHMVAMALAQRIITPPPIARLVSAGFNPALKAA
jgi:DNA-binding NarL/FixJ family response regulator